MTTAELVTITALALYIIQIGVLLRSLAQDQPEQSRRARPTASVVIAARNEESNISACLESVLRQTYPSDRYDVVVVDDESSDATRSIVLETIAKNPHVRLVSTVPEEPLRGKGRALAQGIDACSGEIIMITDADCVVPSTWVEETASRYDDGLGLLSGMTLQSSHSSFGGMQSLDWAYLLGIASAATRLGISFGSIGNNLSFRRKAYDEVGGYRKVGFSVTEDLALVQAIRRLGTWRHEYPIDPLMLVESDPCPDWRTLFRQKHRWGKGGLDVPPAGYLVMAVGWTVHMAPLLALTLDLAITFAGTALLLKATADYLFLRTVLVRLMRLDELKHLWAFELWLGAYVISLPFMVLFGRAVHWKGRVYR